MKKTMLLFSLLLAIVSVQAQDYLISFAGTGASASVGTVKVENLTQKKSITLNGSEVLHLVSTSVGINPLLDAENALYIYPNPTTNNSTIQFVASASGKASVELFDITGKRLCTAQNTLTIGPHSYQVSGLRSGIYTTRISSQAYTYTGKLVSNGTPGSDVKISYIGNGEIPVTAKRLKSANAEKLMQYNDGDLLKYTGTTGNYNTIVADVPTQSKTLTFTFVACTDADGNNYPVIQIGTQIWMGENLKTTKYRNGNPITNVTDNSAWQNLKTEAYCNYNNDASIGNKYGKLYNGYAVSDSRNLTPAGWHVPTNAEWTMLTNYLAANLGTSGSIAKTLASKTDWTSSVVGGAVGNDLTKNNTSCFNALPSGFRGGYESIYWQEYRGGFYDISNSCFWWCSFSLSYYAVDTNESLRSLGKESGDLISGSVNSGYGLSVRCIVGDIPVLSTNSANSVSASSAICGGNIASDGGETVTERGVCYSTVQNPSTFGSKITIGSGTGTFSSTISGLKASTTYYVRAYATNKFGTFYGNQISFTTQGLATVTTSDFTGMTTVSTICGGNVIYEGGVAVTERGVCYNTSPNPTINNNRTVMGNGIGTFSNLVTDLTPNTTYYLRAYAINSVGASYGNAIKFKTFTGTVTDIDGNVYNTVTIGKQVWTVENLKTTKYNDGTSIPNVTDNTAWSILTTPGYCWYNNDAANKSTYGALYNWDAVNTGKLCPTDWHVATNEEWTELTTYLYGKYAAFVQLIETGTSHWESPYKDTGATNETSFTALPGGRRGEEGTFGGVGRSGSWWSSTENNGSDAWYWSMDTSSPSSEVFNYYHSKVIGHSVRCILDPFAVNTTSASSITNNSAICGGNITGGSAVTERGVCYSTSQDPTISDNKMVMGLGSGDFSNTISGLSANTTYYVRAYATNSVGTTYGDKISFKTYTGTVTDIDGNIYNTVTIGTQVWMAKNLKTTKYKDGTNIPNVTNNSSWSNLSSPGYCWYNNNIVYKNTYGALYNWYVVNTQKLAPIGWHVASDAEWTTLTTYLGGKERAGLLLKENGITHWESSNVATDEYKFTAYPGGARNNDGSFLNLYYNGYWWSSISAWWMSYDNSEVMNNSYSNKNGCSVRCIKD